MHFCKASSLFLMFFLSTRCPPAITQSSHSLKEEGRESDSRELCLMFVVVIFNLQLRSAFGSHLHKLTESCTREESASYQSALSGLP